MTTNDPQAGYVAEQREPGEALDITILRATETYKIEGELGVKYPVPLWRDIMAIINAMLTSGELMVCKTVKRSDVKWNTPNMDMEVMPCCGRSYDVGDALLPGEFCRCGARIIE